MKGLRVLRTPVVLAVCLGLTLPVSEVHGADVRKATEQPPVEITDVALDAQGGLQGVVVDVHGTPQPAAKVVLVRQRQEIGRVQADQLGRFRLLGLRGGVYMLQSGGQGRFVRAWTAKTAPPNAKSAALMVTGDGVVRGQMPLEQFFASDAVVIVGMVAALIAIPIVVSNQGGSSPASP
jgi:hypothetical protein